MFYNRFNKHRKQVLLRPSVLNERLFASNLVPLRDAGSESVPAKVC